jgi:hypothetical protein
MIRPRRFKELWPGLRDPTCLYGPGCEPVGPDSEGGEDRTIVTDWAPAQGRADRVVLVPAAMSAACNDRGDCSGWDKAETG